MHSNFRNSDRILLVDEEAATGVYEKLAPLTKRDYDRHLAKIGQAWGSAPVASLTTVLAQEAIDLQSHTPAGARYFRAVLSKLLSFGAARGYCETNVARVTEKLLLETCIASTNNVFPIPPHAETKGLARARVTVTAGVAERYGSKCRWLRPSTTFRSLQMFSTATAVIQLLRSQGCRMQQHRILQYTQRSRFATAINLSQGWAGNDSSG